MVVEDLPDSPWVKELGGLAPLLEPSIYLSTYSEGVVVEDLPDAPWVKELGGLVPLLVAYEEELKSLKVTN